MSPEEVTKFVDGTFAKNLDFRNTFLGMNMGGVKQMPLLAMTVSDIPSEQLDLVKQSLANKGVTEPSNDQILRTYWNGKINAR